MRISVILCPVFAAAFVLAEEPGTRIDGPRLGWLRDQANQIRPIHGLVGSARIGDPLSIGADAADVRFAPGQDYALVLTGADRSASVLDIAAGSMRPVSGATAGASRLILSPRGSAALLYFAETRRIEAIAGLPNAPQVDGAFELPEEPSELAVSDDAKSILSAQGGAVSSWSSKGDLRAFYPAAGSLSFQFFNNSGDAVIADRTRGKIIVLAESGELTEIAGEGIRSPRAAAVSEDNQSIFIMSDEDAAVLTLARDGRLVSSIACQCQPTRLERLRESVFLLTDTANVPLWVFDGSGEGRIAFIPGVPPRSEEAAQ